MNNLLIQIYKALHFPAFFLLKIIFTGVFFFMGNKVLQVFSINPSHFLENYESILNSLFTLIGVTAFIITTNKFLGTVSLEEIGISFSKQGKNIASGLLLSILFVSVQLSAVVLFNEWSGISFSINENLDYSILIRFLLFFSIVALEEELFFRGFIDNELLKSFKKEKAFAFSSIIFAISHFPPFIYLYNSQAALHFLVLILTGLIFSFFYYYSKNIWLTTALHTGWNFMQVFYGIGGAYDRSYTFFKLNPINVGNYIDTKDAFVELGITSIALILIIVFTKGLLTQR